MRGEALSPSGSSVAFRCQAGGIHWLRGQVVTGKGEIPCLANTCVNAVFKNSAACSSNKTVAKPGLIQPLGCQWKHLYVNAFPFP